MSYTYKRPESFSGRISDDHIPYRRQMSDKDDRSLDREGAHRDLRPRKIGILNIDHSRRDENVAYFWVSIKGEGLRKNYNNMMKATSVGGRPVPKKRHPEIPSLSESMHAFLFQAGNSLTESVTSALTDHYSRLDDAMQTEYIITDDLLLMERDAYLDEQDREDIRYKQESDLLPYTPEGHDPKKHMFRPQIEIERST